jgi:hypothetical protein
MAVTVQMQFESVVTEIYQDAFIGSSIENGTTVIQFDLRRHNFQQELGTQATLCWRKESYHVDVHELSTFHNPILYRFIVAQGSYLDSIGIFIFCAGSVSSYRDGGRGCPVHTGEEWTVRRYRGTTTVPSQSSPHHSVDADAGSTRTGLECLSANLCRSLGGVSAYPSALSDSLLR